MTQPNSKPRFRPVIRVFVSSTFSDLKAERNALQAQVFPRLELLCAQNGFQFQAIDLRWGVSSEAGLDHRTMRICFDELRRAQEISPRPNFLILLGNRYGWRPLPEEISVKEFEELKKAATTDHMDHTDDTDNKHKSKASDQKSEIRSPSVIREIREIRGQNLDPIAVLNAWYRKDDNAVPPVYLLQSRRQQLPDGKDYTQNATWNEIQAILWEIINRAHSPEQLRGRFDAAALAEGSPPAIVRFQASATEQEIWHGALRVPDAPEHVLAFFRQIENAGEFSDPAQIKDFVDLKPSGKVDAALGAEQERLKEALKPRLGEKNIFAGSARLVPVRDSQVQHTADVTIDHLAQLCTDVEKRMTEIIQVQIEEYWNQTAKASTERAARELKIEQDEHERFGRERGGADTFVGRQTELQAIRDYLQNDSPWPLVVHGASGCGKTALLARAAEEMQKSEACGQKPTVILRFIGVTPRSSDIRSLLGSLCQELRLQHPREGELPTDIKALSEEMQEHFRFAKPEQPLILFLDALDQLSDADNGRMLNWIPTGQLPGHVKLVVSCLSDRAKEDPAGQPFAELTRRQLPAENSINLDALAEDDARTLLFDRWLPQAGRTVSRDQRERIGHYLKSGECRQPIYLKLLFEEARLWRSYDAAPELGESVPAILGQLIERLGQPANHGRLLVERVLGYLAASRHGLAENEILEVLFADSEYKAALDQATEQTRHELPASATRIPIAIWSRLRFDLAPYLTERAAPGANVLTFYHRQVAEWVQEDFVKASEHSWQPHRRLADYFSACAKGTAEEWETDSVRGFAECVYQLIKAGQHEQAAGLLSNFPFLLHKTRLGLLEGVFDDYDLRHWEAPASVAKQLEIWTDFFREKAHILRRGNQEWPAHKILLQLSVEHADESPLTIAAEKWLKENCCDWLWLRRVPRLPYIQKNPCLAVLEGHTGAIDGALVLTDRRLLSWSIDNTLRLWDGQTGKCLALLEGHSDFINGALELSDGRLLSWSSDNTLRLWAGHSGARLAVLKGHYNNVSGALALADGRLLSWSVDGTLRLWDGQTGECLALLEGHTNRVNGALVLADGRLLSWANDSTLRLWDGHIGVCLTLLEGHTNWVKGALALADGRLLSWAGELSTVDDNTLRLWDSRNGVCLAVLSGHAGTIDGALELSDGRLLSWSIDGTLRLWDGQSGKFLALLEGHTSLVNGALVLADGRLLSWSIDNTLRLWDGHSGLCLAVLEGHANWVMGALELADGRLLSYSNDKTLRLWDGHSGMCLTLLEGHTDWVKGAVELADGRLLSWSSDNALRLWDHHRIASEGIGGHTDLVQGVLVLADERLLSWSRDKTLRIWNSQTGVCLMVIEGHTGDVYGALALADGRLLSCSNDKTLRLWDSHNGACLAVLKGHTDSVMGALELADGRLLSWSGDSTLRLWDGQNGVCQAVLKGHTRGVRGALPLNHGRLLSWSRDGTLRLWDSESNAFALADVQVISLLFNPLRLCNSQSGACLAVLEGHNKEVRGAMVFADGRLLSWSQDGTLRLWDGQNGKCLAVLMGHTIKGQQTSVSGALVLADGRLLSWTPRETLRLWDCHSGNCLCVIAEDQIAKQHPEWLYLRSKIRKSGSVVGDFYVTDFAHGDVQPHRSMHLRHKTIPWGLAVWNADSDSATHCLLADGTAAATQANGQVCILKLYYGNRRVSLAEVEEILALQKKPAK